MFLTLEIVEQSLKRLKSVHPFFGMTFLVCQSNNLPVGKVTSFPINHLENSFLRDYFKPNEKSERFYQVFKSSKKEEERWLNSDYASSSLQSIRTRGDLAKAFIHERKTDLWGWTENYVELLGSYLKSRRIPAFYLAVWLFREREFSKQLTAENLIQLLFKEFKINNEVKVLFDVSIPKGNINLFNDKKVSWSDLRTLIGTPDNEPEESGVLDYLEINGVGPARKMIFEPSERLNLIAGDNGLGKSFILDCAWWALTGSWSGVPAYPREWAEEPTITFKVLGKSKVNKRLTAKYARKAFGDDKWTLERKRPVLSGLSLYVRVDGSFAIFDPARREDNFESKLESSSDALVFTGEQIKNGYEEQVNGRTQARINGLIRDWVSWQFSPDQNAFDKLSSVLRRLSPPQAGDLGVLKPGKPVRLAGDSRQIPTIEHPYGTIPIVHASAGVQRILTIAYLLVWAWQEHQINSANLKKEPERKMVVLIDEVESHLHPQWQRSILPSLLNVGEDLSSELALQLIIATHSPLVIGSCSPHIDLETDKLFHIDLVETNLFGKEAEIQEVDFVNYGKVGSWLMSDVFEFAQDQTSLEAEKAIKAAQKLQRENNPSKENILKVSADLLKNLSDLDPFLPRWISFATKNGVEL